MVKETPEELKKRLAALKEKVEGFYNRPWELYHEPFHVAGPVYYLGNRYVSNFLVDTGEGLVLIDCGFKETLYQTLEGIRTLGFDPHDIKHLFLSHGHVDHCGSARFIQEYTGCKVWIGEGDLFFFTERRDLIIDEDRVPEFRIDMTYDYTKPFPMGNVTFHFKHTPGHTPGCTTFLIDIMEDGRKLTCAMHGGIGINGLSIEELRSNRLPETLQRDFYESLKEAKTWHVDVVLPSHNHNYDILTRYAADDGSGKSFVDPLAWGKMIDSMIEKLMTIM